MFYHLFDLDTSSLLETGRNSATLDELKQSLLSYLDTGEMEQEDFLLLSTLAAQEIVESVHMSIETTPHKI